MSEPMGMYMLIQVCSDGPLAQDPTRFTSGKPPRAAFTPRPKRDEERFTHHTRMAPNIQPRIERKPRLFRDRNDALLPALPHHANFSRSQLQITNVEGNELADANPSAVEQLDERPVAERHPLGPPFAVAAFRSRLARNTPFGRDQLFAIVDRERSRQTLFELRHRQAGRRVVPDHTLSNQPPEEASDRSEFSTQGCGAAASMQTREPGSNVFGVDRDRIDFRPGVNGELPNIGLVGAARMRREPSLDAKMLPKSFDRLGPVHHTPIPAAEGWTRSQ
jgi:hypothetical protein